MLTYMEHPYHGTHIAYSPDEVERCKLYGWKVREETKAKEPEPARQKLTLPQKVKQ